MRRRDVVKIVSFWILFLVLTAVYQAFPVAPLKVICPIYESVFQHMKGIFYAYALVNMAEYALRRKALEQRVAFVYARMLTTIIIPWLMFLLWYMGPAYYGPMPTIPLEVVYANVIMVLIGICAVLLERGFETMRYARELKLVIVLLLIISISLYTIFTFKLPWADVFTLPAGWE